MKMLLLIPGLFAFVEVFMFFVGVADANINCYDYTQKCWGYDFGYKIARKERKP